MVLFVCSQTILFGSKVVLFFKKLICVISKTIHCVIAHETWSFIFLNVWGSLGDVQGSGGCAFWVEGSF